MTRAVRRSEEHKKRLRDLNRIKLKYKFQFKNLRDKFVKQSKSFNSKFENDKVIFNLWCKCIDLKLEVVSLKSTKT